MNVARLTTTILGVIFAIVLLLFTFSCSYIALREWSTFSDYVPMTATILNVRQDVKRLSVGKSRTHTLSVQVQYVSGPYNIPYVRVIKQSFIFGKSMEHEAKKYIPGETATIYVLSKNPGTARLSAGFSFVNGVLAPVGALLFLLGLTFTLRNLFGQFNRQ